MAASTQSEDAVAAAVAAFEDPRHAPAVAAAAPTSATRASRLTASSQLARRPADAAPVAQEWQLPAFIPRLVADSDDDADEPGQKKKKKKKGEWVPKPVKKKAAGPNPMSVQKGKKRPADP